MRALCTSEFRTSITKVAFSRLISILLSTKTCPPDDDEEKESAGVTSDTVCGMFFPEGAASASVAPESV